jgi:glycosyltransferase involved in cell wall biosynthesis
MTGGLHDPFRKRLPRGAYRIALGLHERISAPISGGGTMPRVFFGGGRPGDHGGPRVKIRKLAEVFPEHLWTYNLVYVLSNAPYLPTATLGRLRGRGIPIVGNQNGVFYPAWYAGDCDAENRRMAEQYHLADFVFHQSDFCRRSAEHFLGRRDGAGEILYNAVDTARFTPSARERADEGPFVFLLAGKVQAHQAYRLETAIEGLAAARRNGLDGHLRVAGAIAPAAIAKARARAEASGIAAHLEILGPYAQEAAPGLFAAADAFVTTTHNDACPSAVLEAMACGLPVVYAASGGVPELVGNDAGVALETGESWDEALMPEATAIADGMLRVAAEHQIMSAAARRRAVERFDIGPWIERHREIFGRLLGHSR